MEESHPPRALTGIATPRLHDMLQTALGMLVHLGSHQTGAEKWWNTGLMHWNMTSQMLVAPVESMAGQMCGVLPIWWPTCLRSISFRGKLAFWKSVFPTQHDSTHSLVSMAVQGQLKQTLWLGLQVKRVCAATCRYLVVGTQWGVRLHQELPRTALVGQVETHWALGAHNCHLGLVSHKHIITDHLHGRSRKLGQCQYLTSYPNIPRGSWMTMALKVSQLFWMCNKAILYFPP
jgi:hypothetical protein